MVAWPLTPASSRRIGPKIESVDPRADYCYRLDARSVIASRYQRLHLRIGNARLILALFAVALAVLSLVYHYLSTAYGKIGSLVEAKLYGSKIPEGFKKHKEKTKKKKEKKEKTKDEGGSEKE